MSENKIIPGSQVQLKSGGPTMTVIRIDDDEVVCRWFDKNNVKGEVFTLASIEVVDSKARKVLQDLLNPPSD